MDNGMAERFNRILLNMLETLEDYMKADWKYQLPALVHVYMSTCHESTGYAPHTLGLVVRKPVFGVSDKAALKPVSTATETS